VTATAAVDDAGLDALAEFVASARRLVVVTGAGLSVASGIAAYRDASGRWQHPPPVLWPDFARDPRVRQRYWGRSLVGWPRFAVAHPNAGHAALADLGAAGRVAGVITQNVDGLHQRAGSHGVIDLHGRLDAVRCAGCGARLRRADLQVELEGLNPDWHPRVAAAGPDGDARLADADYARVVVPDCRDCGGMLRPDVVFFGEALLPATAAAAAASAAAADALLVVGSSLTVYSGFRLVRDAAARGARVASLGLGRTRADGLMSLRVVADAAAALPALVRRLASGGTA
jgi:NAD-dependent SIR2 family protein deacetylase